MVVSNSTVSRLLKRLNLTRKKKRYMQVNDIQKERVEYWERIQEVRSEDIVLIDEAGSNRGMTRLQRRAEISTLAP